MKYLLSLLLLSVWFTKGNPQTVNEQKSNEQVAETKYFSFHSNFYLNLHHFLYKKAQLLAASIPDDTKQFEYVFADELNGAVDANDQQIIIGVLQFYKDSVCTQNLLFSPFLTEFKYALEKNESLESFKGTSYEKLAACLRKSAAFYSANYWDNQKRQNEIFVHDKMATLLAIESNVIAGCEKYYNWKFNGIKFRVDLADYATFYGAYTTNDPVVNAVVSSTDKRHEGTQGIELLFHEISHSMTDTLMMHLQEHGTKPGLTPDRNLWHIILFYSTGVLVKDELDKIHISHRLYLDQNHLAELSPVLAKQIQAVEKIWPAYLHDKATLDETIAGLLKALSGG